MKPPRQHASACVVAGGSRSPDGLTLESVRMPRRTGASRDRRPDAKSLRFSEFAAGGDRRRRPGRPDGRAAPGRHAPGGRAGQAQPGRRRHRLGAGRHRRRARHRRQHRHRTCATRRTPAPAWSTSTPRASSPSTAREAVEWLVERGVPFSPDPEGPLGLHLTREGGHAVRRIAHAADATGKAIHEALLDAGAAPSEHHAARALDGGRPDHLAPPASATSRRAATASMRSTSTSQRVETLPARGGGAGHRRRRQGLSLHDQPRHLHRRRHRDGLARRLPRRQHGVHPVPSDLPVPPAGAQLPHHRGAARRGRR